MNTFDSAFFNGLAKMVALARRSVDRYVFEQDFRVRPNQVYSYSQGRSSRKQLHIGFDAVPPPTRYYSRPWGVSIGLCFDFRKAEMQSQPKISRCQSQLKRHGKPLRICSSNGCSLADDSHPIQSRHWAHLWFRGRVHPGV
jgi:hypothetical protein